MADHRWMRTVVSRCSTLDIVLVKSPAGQKWPQPSQQLGRRLARCASYRAADRKRGFAWDDDDYVTPAWIEQTLVEQGHRCVTVRATLDPIGGAQISNDRPHSTGNCDVREGPCQHRSAHRA